MSDHFYITSTAIKLFERWPTARSELTNAYAVIPTDQAETLIKLVKKLSGAVKSNGAKLYIAACPCLANYPCAGPDIERLLQDASNQSKDFVVLPLAIELESKFKKSEIKKKDMRFYNDLHLSKYGHDVVAKELAQFLGEVR